MSSIGPQNVNMLSLVQVLKPSTGVANVVAEAAWLLELSCPLTRTTIVYVPSI